jgi:hypothetical protein
MSTQHAWAAGLFDGEGCIHIGRQTKAPHNKYYQLTLGMNDLDVVERFADLWGVGKVWTRHATAKWNTFYYWRISKRTEVARILAAMLPYFGNRRAHKALDILDDIECN